MFLRFWLFESRHLMLDSMPYILIIEYGGDKLGVSDFKSDFVDAQHALIDM